MGSHDLQRFKDAQDQEGSGFQSALAEIEAGAKYGHWIWYVFPQLSGLGHSWAAETYAIANLAEAMDFIRDPVLGSRLLAITTTVAGQLKHGVPLTTLMGSRIDVLKLVSSLTLFAHAAKLVYEVNSEERHRALAAAAEEVLDLAKPQGYARCTYTRDSIQR